MRGFDLDFIAKIHECKKSEKCRLILVTNGGDANAAYKIGRYLQQKYESVTVVISGLCKSAGTLLAISASELVFTPYGELGPLDVQTLKPDSPFDLRSGLNISEALYAIEQRAKDTYHSMVGGIIEASQGVFSIQTATDAASEMVGALYSPLFGRIDPEEVGSRARDMRISEYYATRLNQKWSNLKVPQIHNLVMSYPSHSFVIDSEEAKALFENVRMAKKEEMNLVENLGELSRLPGKTTKFRHLSNHKG